ncbi:efflux RND transporter periplasmic adaptor subunit [Pseudoxanthomonas sangjuensis]|uniref:efflux RND transporter periplasmic adaptor subunit n=1 Tax=Pseudoxanthomonas sangjuensis TaxID=1503750 RepID=UPI0013910A00|nr:efflux RND transporter periplasmic adaptor subunit [Pseudoxanthomonas sangjuensis]KAF1714139.1 efflux transporter periplasmic adaptor subunit [Pseudoxanthomonas sangjuensis]
MIRDTSAQDQVLAKPAGRGRLPRWAWSAAGAALLVLGIVWVGVQWLGGARSYDASRLRIAEVTRGDLVRDISADGRVIAANSPTLYAIAAGTVSLKVVAGDKVAKGQELAVIDSPELRSKLVQEESTLASLEAEAGRARLDAQIARLTARKALDQAQIDHTAALRDLERYQRAYDGGAVSKNELNRAEDEVKKAQIGLGSAHKDFDLQAAGAGLDARNKQLLADRQRAVVAEARRQVDALTLRAPFDGQVGQVQVPQGTSVVANGPVLSVVDLSKFEVEIRVPESFARDLAIGMPAQLTSGSGQPYPGEISAVSPEVVNGEVVARIRFSKDQPPGLRQNQRLSARILMDTRRNVLKVERGPFVEQSGGRYAYVMDGNVAVRRPVRLGVSSLSEIEVLDGLQPGDRVVVSGSDLFGDAEKVKVN